MRPFTQRRGEGGRGRGEEGEVWEGRGGSGGRGRCWRDRPARRLQIPPCGNYNYVGVVFSRGPGVFPLEVWFRKGLGWVLRCTKTGVRARGLGGGVGGSTMAGHGARGTE